MQSENTLLGCPHCGGEARWITATGGFSIGCWNDNCYLSDGSYNTYLTEIEAARQWNTRTTHDALKREVKELQWALEKALYRIDHQLGIDDKEAAECHAILAKSKGSNHE